MSPSLKRRETAADSGRAPLCFTLPIDGAIRPVAFPSAVGAPTCLSSHVNFKSDGKSSSSKPYRHPVQNAFEFDTSPSSTLISDQSDQLLRRSSKSFFGQRPTCSKWHLRQKRVRGRWRSQRSMDEEQSASVPVTVTTMTASQMAAPPGTASSDHTFVSPSQPETFQLAAQCSSLADLWPACAKDYEHIVALNDPVRQPAVELTFRQLEESIRTFAIGLQTLGLEPGDNVSLFSENSNRWLIADQAILAAGAADAVRGSKAPAAELAYILSQSDSTALFVEDLPLLISLLPVIDRRNLRFVVLLYGEVSETVPGLSIPVYSFDNIMRRGVGGTFHKPSLSRDSLATIIYTSGTTGNPKGVMLTHGNLLSQLEYLGVCSKPRPGDVVLSLLPPWHVYERSAELFFLSRGCTEVYTSVPRFRRDITHFKPHAFAGVPRLFETFYNGIMQKIAALPVVKRTLITLFMALSSTYVKARRTVKKATATRRIPEGLAQIRAIVTAAVLWPLHKLASLLFYSKIREAVVGPRLIHALSAGGTLAAFLDDFFEMLGLEILVGYGLSETSPTITARRYNYNVRNTCGVPLTHTELRVVDPETREPVGQGTTGLIMARGPQVMRGYYKNAEATAKVLTAEGWFDTGDRGWFTPTGNLVITGRYKDTIVLSNGENIEPEAIEDALLESSLIQQVVLVGQDQKCLGALIVPNLDELRTRLSSAPSKASSNGASSSRVSAAASRADLQQVAQKLAEQGAPLPSPDDLDKLFATEQSRLVTGRPNFRADERIGPFRLVLEPFSEENGLLTQTFKIKRNLVMDKYQTLIDEMFGHAA